MLNTKNKLLLTVLTGLLVLDTSCYLKQLHASSQLNAGIIHDTGNEYTDLTTSHVEITGTVGDIVTDFVVDYKGKSINSYTVTTDDNVIKNTGSGIKLVGSGEGIATLKYGDSTLKLNYCIQPDPNAPVIEKVASNKVETQAPTTVNYKTCTITSNGVPAKGIIMYIDDSKNAFKSTGTFYIEESFLDGKTHTIYIAKFTNKGPVAYAVTQFTSLANEVNFMNYNSSEVEISNLRINLKASLNKLL